MIDQNTVGGAAASHLTEIPFPSKAAGNRYRPNGNYVRVAYSRETVKGGIHIPTKAKPMDFVLVTVLDAGPDAKQFKGGDRCLVATKGLINFEQGGVDIDGEQTWWTQANLIVTVIESALATSEAPH